MGGFDLSTVPLWVWILLVIAAAIVTPMKLKVLKKMLGKKESEAPPED